MSDPEPGTLDRLKESRLVQAVAVFCGASWVILQVVDMMIERMGLPAWVFPATLALLVVGLLVVVATAWVQSLPSTSAGEERGEVPGDWEVAPGLAFRQLLRGRLPHLTWGRAIVGGVVAFGSLVALAGLWTLITGRPPAIGPSPLQADAAPAGIAVLPFSTNTPELDLWSDGLVDVLSTSLDGVAGYRTIDSRTVLSRWDRNVAEGTNPDLRARLAVAADTDARYAMVGSVVALGPSVRLSADIYDLADGSRVAGGLAEGPADSVLAVVERLGSDAMRSFLTEVGGEGVTEARMGSLTTSSLEAMRDFLEGEALYRGGSLAAAGEAYVRALREDTTFALAAYRADQVFGWAYGGEDGRWASGRLSELRDELPQRERLFADMMYRLGTSGIETRTAPEMLVRSYPDDAEAWNTLGEFQIHLPGIALADHADTRQTFDEAVRLSPDFFPTYIHPIELSISMGDSARAEELLAAMERLSSEEPRYEELALAHELYFGDLREDLDRVSAGDMDEMMISVLGRSMGGVSPLPPLVPRLAALVGAIPHAGDPLVTRISAEIALATGKPAEAWRIWESLPEDDPHRAIAAYSLSALPGGAEAAPDAASTVYPPDHCAPDAHRWCERAVGFRLVDAGRSGDALTLANRMEQAAEAFEPADPRRWIRLAGARAIRGYAALRAGNDSAARRFMTEAMAVRFSRYAQWALATHHEQRGELARAVELYRSFDGSPTYSPFAHLALGRIHERLGQPERAIGYYRSALSAWGEAEGGFEPRRQAEAGLARLGG